MMCATGAPVQAQHRTSLVVSQFFVEQAVVLGPDEPRLELEFHRWLNVPYGIKHNASRWDSGEGARPSERASSRTGLHTRREPNLSALPGAITECPHVCREIPEPSNTQSVGPLPARPGDRLTACQTPSLTIFESPGVLGLSRPTGIPGEYRSVPNRHPRALFLPKRATEAASRPPPTLEEPPGPS